MDKEKKYTEAEAHRHFARGLNKKVWELLGKAERTPQEDLLMIHAAHTSMLHWLEIGTPLNHQRGEWLVSNVYAQLGLPEGALRHATRCQQLTEEHASLMADFDKAYAIESMARAHAVAGNLAEVTKYRVQAEATGQAIQDEEDRKIFFGDFNTGNWGNLA